jgi:single-strand DNA-binding protein
MNINKVILAGRVGTVEVKEFGTGRIVVQASIATTDGYKKNDEWVNTTEWHRLIFAIPSLAERAKAIGKGDVIYVEGSINTNEWTTKEGEKKQIKEIACTMFKTFVKAKGEAKEYNQPKTTVSQSFAKPAVEDGDDLPF